MLAQRLQTNVVLDFIDFCMEWLADHKYTLAVDADMSGWAETMSKAPSIALVNPTFDPQVNRLSAQNAFWLDVRAGSRTVATSAARLFLTEDYLELKRSLRLWYDLPPQTDRTLRLTLPTEFPKICGNVGHEGGLWVHPDHRKRGLSVILPHLNRALALREWNVDWQTGLTLRGIGESGIATWAYGFPHVVQCSEGWSPLTGGDERMFITYMDRDELVAGLELETVARLLPDRNQQPVHAAAGIQKR